MLSLSDEKLKFFTTPITFIFRLFLCHQPIVTVLFNGSLSMAKSFAAASLMMMAAVSVP